MFKKLNFVLCLFLLTALVLVGASCGESSSKSKSKKEEEPKEKYLTYKNTDWNFQIDYPEKWEEDVAEQGTDYVMIAIVSPAENDKDNFQENLVVAVGLPDPYNSFEDLMQGIIEDSSDEQYIKDFKYSKVKVAGYPAYKFTYTELWEEGNLKYLFYFLDAGDRWAYLLYTAEEDSYSEYLDQVEEMVDSFKLK